MPSPSTQPFTTGDEAAERVAADPFWSVVRRRHPDVDVVVLPAGDAAPPDPAEVASLPEVDAADAAEGAARGEAEALALWTALVGAEPGTIRTRWAAGRASGTHRLETTLRLDDVDPTAAVAAVGRAEDALAADGWHVLAPGDGLPRVLAGRGEGLGRAELQLVHAPAEARLVLRVRAGDVRLGTPSEVDA
ncbi:hypothetical protein QWY28_09945 [Nocardioides sp. SOB77]|uniref:Uncharacterized protein n=1 Tax=Nocardioides oceani TaxID=3058369 RepID=A0ABT8FF14_9ACTN|nr:hypothetical protein [Nocardioides oceani]MDN4173263.1 hypothetical protein [Nocardioides oceani]